MSTASPSNLRGYLRNYLPFLLKLWFEKWIWILVMQLSISLYNLDNVRINELAFADLHDSGQRNNMLYRKINPYNYNYTSVSRTIITVSTLACSYVSPSYRFVFAQTRAIYFLVSTLLPLLLLTRPLPHDPSLL